MLEFSFLKLSKIISPIFYKLIFMSIKASVFGIIITIFLKLFKDKILPKVKYIICFSFIILLIIPIKFDSNFSIFPSKIEDIERIVDDEVQEYFKSNTDNNIQKINDKTINVYEEDNNLRIELLIPLIWFLSVLIILGIYIVCYEIFNKKIQNNYIIDKNILFILEKCKRKLGINKKIDIVYQQLIGVPSLFGIIDSRIIFNDDIKCLSDKELEFILTHELIHYKRKDNLSNVIIITLKVLFCFNPLIWILLEQIKKYMEMAVDYEVTKDLSDEDKKLYCKTLVKLTSMSSSIFLAKEVSLSDNKRILSSRIDMIKLDFNVQFRYIFSLILIIILSMYIICLNEDYKLSRIKNMLENSLKVENYYKLEEVNRFFYSSFGNVSNDSSLNNIEENNKIIYVFNDYDFLLNNLFKLLEMVENNYLNYKYIEKQKYNGNNCVVFSIFSGRNNYENVEWRCWIDIKTGFVLKQELYYNSNSSTNIDLPVYKIEYDYKKK